MTDFLGEAPIALGFLTVVAEPQDGLIGGYLIVSAHARPLEFHCTVPIRANCAQEILYGPTLPPYLYGEQIGSTLVKTSKLRPLAVFTDCPPALAAAAHIEMPLWLVLPPADTNSPGSVALTSAGSVPAGDSPAGGPTTATAAFATTTGACAASAASALAHRVDLAHVLPEGLAVTRCGRNRLTQGADYAAATRASMSRSGLQDPNPAAEREIDEPLAGIAAAFDLCEPFDRIRAAIQEAQRGGR